MIAKKPTLSLLSSYLGPSPLAITKPSLPLFSLFSLCVAIYFTCLCKLTVWERWTHWDENKKEYYWPFQCSYSVNDRVYIFRFVMIFSSIYFPLPVGWYTNWVRLFQCCGSVTFWYGPDPYHQCWGSGSIGSVCFWGLPDPHPDPLVTNTDPDPSVIRQKY
jgi:hypothetical protein